MEPIGQNPFQTATAASSPVHQNNSGMDMNGSCGSFNSPSKLENGFSSTPQKMSMSPIYAPVEVTRSLNNHSPLPEYNSQSGVASAAATFPTNKDFPNYFNNHISNGE